MNVVLAVAIFLLSEITIGRGQTMEKIPLGK